MRESGGLCCGVDCLSFACTAKPREQGNQVQLPEGFVVFLTWSLWEPLKEIFGTEGETTPSCYQAEQAPTTAQPEQGPQGTRTS